MQLLQLQECCCSRLVHQKKMAQGSPPAHRLTRHQDPPVQVKDAGLMFTLIRASFNQRRKTLQNGLYNSPELFYTKAQIAWAIEQLGVSAQIRGEALTLEQFGRLSDIFSSIH